MKKTVRDETIALLIRMWVAGIICLFVAWSPIGGGEDESDSFIFQMIFFLALFLFIANILVVNPVIRGMLKTTLDVKSYYAQSVWKRSFAHLLHFGKMILITVGIWGMYIVIDVILGWIGLADPYGRPILMLEPISFGVLYGLLFFLFTKIEQKIQWMISKRRDVS